MKTTTPKRRLGWVKAWKVVSVHNTSVVELGESRLSYRKGKYTKPLRGAGPICCFRTRRSAEQFSVANYGASVLRVELKPSRETTIWRKESNFRPTAVLGYYPETILADEIYVIG